ncbi:hypothetical protein DACRYDRAFT_111242 [Dacryopinax primogenitus]|uniref:Uncharacterized protein n=1 Tax=Dacryopinax primogenitus (strain DJM 731) TaxID=1858805 RepID=M5FP68_DACPD|nr:uncharacterized protein DACRYDRAFT_111242 [Dacryopinax primogenitus]EJT98270.1 hypothetical protein DACRYDRAFT_111242 [Dacryopinax primogenitus]
MSSRRGAIFVRCSKPLGIYWDVDDADVLPHEYLRLISRRIREGGGDYEPSIDAADIILVDRQAIAARRYIQKYGRTKLVLDAVMRIREGGGDYEPFIHDADIILVDRHTPAARDVGTSDAYYGKIPIGQVVDWNARIKSPGQ